jgi:hypothetical protein
MKKIITIIAFGFIACSIKQSDTVNVKDGAGKDVQIKYTIDASGYQYMKANVSRSFIDTMINRSSAVAMEQCMNPMTYEPMAIEFYVDDKDSTITSVMIFSAKSNMGVPAKMNMSSGFKNEKYIGSLKVNRY